MAGTRQSNQQAYQQYQQQLADQQKQAEQQQQLQESHKATFDALDDLRFNRHGVVENSQGLQQEPDKVTKDPTELNKGQKRLQSASVKHGSVSMYAGMVGMPYLARDTFLGSTMAGSMKGASYELKNEAKQIRDYKFTQRLERRQAQFGIDEREAAIMAGKMGKMEGVDKMSNEDVLSESKKRFIARRQAPLSQREAQDFAVTKAQISADRSGEAFDSSAVATKDLRSQAVTDFNKGGMFNGLGSKLYDNQSGALGKFTGAASTALPMMPMVSSGLSSARNFESLKRLRDQRATSGTSGKIAEAGGTVSGLLKASLSAPAATGLAMSTLPGLAGTAGNAMFRGVKDTAFGLTGGLGNKILGDGISGSLASASASGGMLGGLASAAPNIAGGLALALPGIVGGIAKGVSKKRQQMLHGSRPTTNKLIKKYSRTVGRVDSLIRKMAMSGQIPGDRALELTLLTYIEQGIAGLAGHAEASSVEKQKDTAASMGNINKDAFDIDANDDVNAWDTLGAKASRGGRRALVEAQALSHAINIPGQLMDFVFQGKTPDARKREFHQERANIFEEKAGKDFAKETAVKIGRSASYVQLLNTPLEQYLSRANANTPEAQTVNLLGGIYSMLRGFFFGVEQQKLKESLGHSQSLEFKGLKDTRNKFTQFMHKIPVISALYDALRIPVKTLVATTKGVGKGIVGGVMGTIKAGKAVIGAPKKIVGAVKSAYDKHPLFDYLKTTRGKDFEGKSAIGKAISAFGLGKKTSEYVKDTSSLVKKHGFEVSYQDSVKKFHKQLPNLWERLIHFQKVQYEALQNIFKTTAATVKALTGEDISYEQKERKQKIFDVQSGEYEEIDKLNKKRQKGMEDIVDEAASGEKHGFFKRAFFTKEYQEKRKAHIREKVSDQLVQNEAFDESISSETGDIDRKVSNVTKINFGKSSGSTSKHIQNVKITGFNKTAELFKPVRLTGVKVLFNKITHRLDKIYAVLHGTKEKATEDVVSVEKASQVGVADNVVQLFRQNQESLAGTGTDGIGFASPNVSGDHSAPIGKVLSFASKAKGITASAGGELDEANESIAAKQEVTFRKSILTSFKKLLVYQKKISKKAGGGVIGGKEGIFSKIMTMLPGIFSGLMTAMSSFGGLITGAISMLVGGKLKGAWDKFRGKTPDVPKPKVTPKGSPKLKLVDPKASAPKPGMFGRMADTVKGKVGDVLKVGKDKAAGLLSKLPGASRAGGLLSKLPGAAKVGGRLLAKAAVPLAALDTGRQVYQDFKDPSRLEDRADAFDKTMSEGSGWDKTKAIAGNIINPYAGGSYVGTKLNRGIGHTMGFLTGGKYKGSGALGEMAFDMFNTKDDTPYLDGKDFKNQSKVAAAIKLLHKQLTEKDDEWYTSDRDEELIDRKQNLLKSYTRILASLKKKAKAKASAPKAPAVTEAVSDGKSSTKPKPIPGHTPPITKPIDSSIPPIAGAAVTAITNAASTNVLETKTEIQTTVIEKGLGVLAVQGKELFELFTNKAKDARDTIDKIPEGYIGNKVSGFVNDATNAVGIQGTQGLAEAAKRAAVATGQFVDDSVAHFQSTINPVNMRQSSQSASSNGAQIQEAGSTYTERQAAADAMIVEQRSYQPTPTGANMGTPMSKSQSVKERPKNKEVEDFCSTLFENTVVVLQQSVKSFGLGQTPFQILT